MNEFIVWLIGSYDPIYYSNSVDGIVYKQIPTGAAGCDWVWICSFIVFLVSAYCILSLVRAFIRR